jgi:CheY-like chemotaxis protein
MIKFNWFGSGRSAETMPAPLAVAVAAAVQQAPQGKRVLIVDDDPVFLQGTAAKLQSAGLQVRTVRESPEALGALAEQPVDAVLIDINLEPDVCSGGMGSLDGFQLLTWMRGHPAAKGARFIMVSGSDAESDRQRAQKNGAVAYFQKPVDHDRLLAAVNAES